MMAVFFFRFLLCAVVFCVTRLPCVRAQPVRVTLTLAEMVDSRLGLSTFADILESYPDLQSYLKTQQFVTLFAPTNAAWNSSIDSSFLDLLQEGGFSRHLKSILEMHVVSDNRILIDDREPDPTGLITRDFTSLNGEILTVLDFNNFDNTAIVVSPNVTNSFVTAANIPASNGIAHEVDKVLLPLWVGLSFVDIPNTVDNLSIFSELFELSGLAPVVPTLREATVFMVTDEAFDDDILAYYRNPSNLDDLRDMFYNHVGVGVFYTDPVDLDNGVVIGSNILVRNGVAHVIDYFLITPGYTAPTNTPTSAPSNMPSLVPLSSVNTTNDGDNEGITSFPDNGNDEDSSIAAFVGGTLGGISAIVIAIVILIWRRRHKTSSAGDEVHQRNEHIGNASPTAVVTQADLVVEGATVSARVMAVAGFAVEGNGPEFKDQVRSTRPKPTAADQSKPDP